MLRGIQTLWAGAVLGLAALALPAVATAAPTAPTAPAESGSVQNASNVGGSLAGATSVAISANYAFVTAGSVGQLSAVNLSDPSAPTVAGTTSETDSLLAATNVTISGNYAYVVSKNRNGPQGSGSNDDGTGNSLTIVDISDPANPTVVGTLHDAKYLFGAYGIAVVGNYAYVAAQGCLAGQPCPDSTVGNSFVVIDVSNKASPTEVGHVQDATLLDHATSVAISGQYAYVTASYANRLTVIDISQSSAPRIVASLLDSTRLNFDVDVTIQGNYAYVADQGSNPAQGLAGLAVVDISNPSAPTVVGADVSSWLNGAYRVRVHGAIAYVAADYAQAATMVDVSAPGAPRVAAGVYDSSHFNNTTGVDIDPSGRYMVMTSPRLSSESGATYPPYPNQSGGPTVTGTVTVLTVDPTPIAVALSSGPASTSTQTAATFAFSAADKVASLACSLDGAPGVPCQSASSQTYAGLAPGAHTFQVTATDAAGNPASSTPYSWSVDALPANSSPPAIGGTATEGEVLTASPGTWTGSPAPTITYQWSDCVPSGTACTPIPGATAMTYTVSGRDIGSTIEVSATASNRVGQATADSAPTPIAAGGSSNAPPPANTPPLANTPPPANTSPPTVNGTAAAGNVLSAAVGSWQAYPPISGYSYTWQRCNTAATQCSAVSGAIGQTYAVGAQDAGHTLLVAVTATSRSGQSTALSAPTPVITAAPANVSAPTIAASAVVLGQRLTARPGGWSGYPAPTSFIYEWQDCTPNLSRCKAVVGATGSSYTVARGDLGSVLTVLVTAHSSSGTASQRGGPTGVVRALAAQIDASLRHQVVPRAPATKIALLLKQGGVAFSFAALASGRLTIGWYAVPVGARLEIKHGQVIGQRGRARSAPVLVAALKTAFGAPGTRRVVIRLTPAGRRLLRGASRIHLTAAGTFAAAGRVPVATLQRFTLLGSAPRSLG